METLISVYCLFTDKGDFEIGMDCLICYIEGCIDYFPKELGSERLYFGNFRLFPRPPTALVRRPTWASAVCRVIAICFLVEVVICWQVCRGVVCFVCSFLVDWVLCVGSMWGVCQHPWRAKGYYQEIQEKRILFSSLRKTMWHQTTAY